MRFANGFGIEGEEGPSAIGCQGRSKEDAWTAGRSQ